MGGYILNKDGIRQEEEKTLYRQRDLELMTTYQLREICRREKIIQGIINPMDKEELVHVLMRYRGTREQLRNRASGAVAYEGENPGGAGRDAAYPIQDRGV